MLTLKTLDLETMPLRPGEVQGLAKYDSDKKQQNRGSTWGLSFPRRICSVNHASSSIKVCFSSRKGADQEGKNNCM